MSGAFVQLPGYLFVTNMSTCRTDYERVDCRGLGSYMKTNYPAFDPSQKCWFFIRQRIVLRHHIYDDRPAASFSVVFSMSIYQPNNQMKAANGGSLVFAIEHLYFPMETGRIFTPANWLVLGPSSSSNPSSSTDSAGDHLTAEIGTARDHGTLLYQGGTIWVQIGIDPPGNSSAAAARKYRVWIDYDHVSHRMSVYADAGEDAPKPANAIASTNLTIRAQYAVLGLFSSMGQLLQVHTWNSTVDRLPGFQDTGSITEKTVILSSVLGSVAATAITTALVFLYLNSKYRRWMKERDELTKIMQGIPGVPAHIDFTEIKKATKNFHETTKLGKGGFGAVYRCKLPAVASTSSRTGRRGAMDVAVKKFTREVEDRRCSDFIAEVSIINRLRHKNIVPLIGEYLPLPSCCPCMFCFF
jgi:interleukin-1 receptor-associated kinase 1